MHFAKKNEEGGKTETENIGQLEQKAFKTPTVTFEDERLRIKYKKGCSRLARLTTSGLRRKWVPAFPSYCAEGNCNAGYCA